MPKLIAQLKTELRDMANPEKASILTRYFKTGRGEYAEGDRFLGISVPEQRKIAKRYPSLSLEELARLMQGKIHEERLVALLILISRYSKADLAGRKEAVAFYLNNTTHINNWDLVDISAGPVLGDYLIGKDRAVLYRLAKSERLWERRIAIMATFAFIRRDDFADTLQIAEILLKDPHDLIHKSAGWMLREIGKRNLAAEEAFLQRHAHEMPRTMLRYAVERFSQKRRRYYLRKKRAGKII